MWRFAVLMVSMAAILVSVLLLFRQRTSVVFLKDLAKQHLTPAAFETFLAWNVYKEPLPKGYEVICSCENAIHIGVSDNLAYPWYILNPKAGELTVRLMSKVGKMEDGPGKKLFKDGSIVDCEFVGEICTGKGRVYNSSENWYYEGDLVQGRKQGVGIFVQLMDMQITNFSARNWPDSAYVYKGEFENDTFSGYGHYTVLNFSYSGEFLQGEMTGLGQMRMGDRTMSGQFEAGELQGFGCEQDKHYVTCGAFKGGARNGKAVRMVSEGLKGAKYLSFKDGVENWW